ncbi:MAG: hypothetical protein HFJ95_09920 [Muribaculaceae bacterium]|nr:hypothetical protein [Muribaculaceae bacterium]
MEKIIIYVLIIAIGVLFDFIKKRARKTASSTSVNKSPTPQLQDSFQQFFALQDTPTERKSQSAKRPEPVQKQERKPVAKHQPSKPFLPGETEIALPAISDEPESIKVKERETPPEVAAHYARWRQAILDAEILQRKF